MVSDIDSLAQTVAPIESNKKWIKTVYRTGLPNVALSLGDDLPHEVMWMLLDREEKQWEKLAESELGGLCRKLQGSKKQSCTFEKTIARTEGFKEYKRILHWKNFTEDKIKRLKMRSNRLSERLQEIEPSAAIRGENELWLAMVLRSRILLDLKPGQLAAVCASVVSEGIKVRAWENNNYIYEPSSAVINVINILNEQRSNLSKLQEKHGVEITCCLDSQFSGMVEAWAAGLTWKEMMMDCAMDDGDLARLLRRTIDILAQIPKLPDIDPVLQSNAKTASSIMDRPPISELTG
ncbi:hypothetical protein NC652_024482 [Populus alba x Populus x berolinensis]|nr:hypothetical protein NC652_024482 [Populus alba x Populus x berolinensis]